jgi:hypothetical protein
VALLPIVNGIGTSAKQVWLPGSNRENQVITNVGQVTVYLGGSTVTTATGLPFPPGSETSLVRNSGGLFAIAAAGPQGSLSVSVGLQ